MGRDAIERVFESHFKQFGRTNLSLESASIWRFGSSLEEEGVLEEKAADGTIIDDGKYIRPLGEARREMAASSGHCEFKHQIVNGSARMISFGGIGARVFRQSPKHPRCGHQLQ